MIQIDETEVFGWEHSIRGMRNPMNSWDKSDSGWCADFNCQTCPTEDFTECDSFDQYIIGSNDMTLMKNLCDAGTDHSKFMRMIVVWCDITAPLYWWKEFDTYKVGTVANSCSTMHKIHSKKLTLDDFSIDHMNKHGVSILQGVIDRLNKDRDEFLQTKDKVHWYEMIQLLPSSFNQKRTVMMNYQVLKNIYHSRKNHKLDEWHKFCEWIEQLPHSELIVGIHSQNK